MSDLISKSALIERIEEERKFLLDRGLTGAEHVITKYLRNIIEDAPTLPDPDLMTLEDLENSFICGYRVKDLILFGKMFHDNGIKREDLTKYSEAYLDGYKRAYDEINAAINKTVNSIVSNEEVNL